MLQKALDPVVELQKQNNEKLGALQGQLLVLQRQVKTKEAEEESLLPWLGNRELFLLAIVVVIQSIIFWLFK